VNVQHVHDGGNLLRQVLEHLDRLLESSQLPGAHCQSSSDVNHDVGVSSMLRFHHGVLVLQGLRPPVVGLGDLVCLAKLGLGVAHRLSLLLGQQNVAGGALGVHADGVLGSLDPRLGIALSPRRLH